MKNIKQLVCTCTACPEQYEGYLDTGEEVYIRLRWGTARIDVNKEPVFYKHYDDDFIGCFVDNEFEEFLKEAGFTCNNIK
jgi:biotin synthase-related radical SAM superfamily protein